MVYNLKFDKNPIFKKFPKINKQYTRGNKLNVKIFEYAPNVFLYLRLIDNITAEDIVNSFNPELYKDNNSIEGSKGKGGSFFISSNNNLFIIKTVSRNETDTIIKYILPKYTRHMKRNCNNSLLCPIYGLYSIEFSEGNNTYFIVMRNIIGPYKDLILRQYDLKGSTVNRIENVDDEIINQGKITDKPKTNVYRNNSLLLNINQNLKIKKTLKDLNFNAIDKYLNLDESSTNNFLTQLEEDSYMLSETDLIDYSLFVLVLDLRNLKKICRQSNVLMDECDNLFFKKKSNKMFNFIKNRISDIISNNNNNIDVYQEKKDNNKNFFNFNYNLNLKELLLGNNNKSINDLSNIDIKKKGSQLVNYKDTKDKLVEKSLLLNPENDKIYKKFIYSSKCKNFAYIFSIIDYFQEYNILKVLESNYKVFTKSGLEKKGVSCMPPEDYYERFVEYITSKCYDYEDIELVKLKEKDCLLNIVELQN